MPFRLLHTADLHLDAAFAGVGITPPWVRQRLAHAGLDTLDRIVDIAIEREVDAALVAGGLWTGSTPTLAARQRLRSALEKLAAHGIQAVVTGTERDRLDVLLAEWHPPPGIGIVPAGELRAGDLGRGGDVVAHLLVGAGAAALTTLAEQPADEDGLPMIGVCALPPGSGPAPGALATLERSPVLYWAMGGRWPARADRLGRGAWVVMAGTPQLRRFPEPGTGAGVVIVDGPADDVISGRMRQPSWIPAAAVELITVPVPLTALRRLGDLADHLDQLARRAAIALPDRLPVLRAIAEGVGPLRGTLIDPVVRGRVLNEVQDRAEEWWWADLVMAPLPRQEATQRMSSRPAAAALGAAAGSVRAMTVEDGVAAAWQEGLARPVGGVPPAPAWGSLTVEATSLALDLVDALEESGRQEGARARHEDAPAAREAARTVLGGERP